MDDHSMQVHILESQAANDERETNKQKNKKQKTKKKKGKEEMPEMMKSTRLADQKSVHQN